MPMLSLEGLAIGVTADRRWQEQAALLERRGATVIHGPTITSRFLEHDAVLRRMTEAVIAEPPGYLVANTGVGMRGWFEAVQTWDLLEPLLAALRQSRILARGPKAAAVVATHGLDVWFRAPNERLDELSVRLDTESLAGQRVVVQEHGDAVHGFVHKLEIAGASVIELPIYRWQLPDDPTPARKLLDAICSGRVDAVTFTSAPAVHNLFELADAGGATDELHRAFERGTVAGCVGSVCADAALDRGIAAPVWPSTGRLGLLVRALSDHFRAQRRHLRLTGVPVIVQGSLVVVGDTKTSLTPRERDVLDLLLDRAGAVVSRPTFLTQVWGSPAHDPHALEVTVARLRTKLGPCRHALHTVSGRGYRLQLDA